MSITEERRRALRSKMEATLGRDETATLMDMIEADRWSELVTKEHLDQRLEPFATKQDLERFATKDDLHQMTIQLITWMLVGQATLVAMVGILILFAV